MLLYHIVETELLHFSLSYQHEAIIKLPSVQNVLCLKHLPARINAVYQIDSTEPQVH